MNKIFKKENIMPVAVLGVICIVVAALLGLVNSFTSKEIETQRLEAANAGKLEVLPGLDVNTMEEITPDGSYPKEVKNITKFDIGYVIETETKGNASGLVLLVGIDNDGKITGVKALKNGETPSFWSSVEPIVTGADGKYNGKTPETLEAELISGATNSSKGVYNGVKAALDAFVIAGGGEVEIPAEPEYTPPVCHRDEADLLALMAELVPDNAGFTEVDFDAEGNNAQYLARVFKENGSLGYVAYVSSISSYYGNVDTENLIHIDNTGKIKSVKNLTWAVSEAAPEYGYNPPNEEKLAEFFEGLGGKDSTTIGEVDLHTGATNTTTTLVATITEALNIVSKIIKADMPTPEDEVKALAAKLIGAESADFTDVTPDDGKYIKKIYKDNGGRGYIAYVSSISAHYGTVDTENLIHIGADGKIKGIKKITWSVSDAAPNWGYNPPSDERLSELYASLNGKNSATIGEVDLKTGATNTTTVLVDTVKEALAAVAELVKKDMPTSEDEVKAFAAELIGAESADFTDVTPENCNYIKRIYKDNGGKGYIAYVSSISANYGTVDTENLIHIGVDGKIKGIKKITWSVSDAAPNWGYNPPSDERLSELYASLNGKNSATIGEVDLKTGATNTTTVLVDTVKEALAAVEELIKADMPTSEEEIKAIATELIGATPDFTDVTPEGMTYVKKIYRDSKSRGYIAYVYSISANYGTVDTENVIYIGADGKISGIKKITWSVSDAAPDWGYNPPSEERVSEIYASLNGKNSTTIGEIDLKTGATNTTTTLINSITEALTATADIISKDMPTPEEEVKALAIELIGSNSGLTDVTPKDTSLVRRLYKDNDGNGFIAYLVAISPNYGTVETETLVFIGNDGRIFHVEKLLWKTSDALWGYEPPKESTVNAFYEKLNGHNLEEFKACFTGENPVLVTNATSTTSRLVEVIIAAFEAVKNLPADEEDVTPDVTPDVQNNTARIIGAVALAVIIVAIAAYIAVPKIIRRRNEDE